MRIPNLFTVPWKSLSWTWIFVLFVLFCSEIHFIVKRDVDTNLMSMAPQIALDDARTQAKTILNENLNRRIIFLVGFPQERRSEFDSLFEQVRSQWRVPSNLQQLLWEALEINSHMDFYRSIAPRLMNNEDERLIALSNDEQLLGRAIATLDSVGHTSLISKSEDPFGFFGDWLTKRLPKNTFLPTGHAPKLFANQKVWGVLLYQDHNPSNIESARDLLRGVQHLTELAQSLDPNAEVLVHGVTYRNALFVESSLREFVAIIIFTMLGIGIIAWPTFRRSSTLFGLLFCAISSYITACCVTTIFFGQLHLWTILVGTLLFGLSSACAGSYYCVRQNPRYNTTQIIQIYLSWRLGIACLACIGAFLLLFWFPGATFHQLSVFIVSGLLAAFLTTVLVIPYVHKPQSNESAFVRRLASIYSRLPLLTADRWIPNLANSVTLGLVIVFVILGGLWKLNVEHDVRTLTNFNLPQREVEAEVEKLLALPSSDHYFLVNGATRELTLMNEEALQNALNRRSIPEIDLHCITKWFPSETRQARVERIKQEAFQKIEKPLSEYLGFPIPQPRYQCTDLVSFDDWYEAPASRPVRHLWMEFPNGYGSIVQIAGITDKNIQEVSHLSHTMAGLSFVNINADFNYILAEYRTLFIGLSFLIVVIYSTLALFYYGLSTWRVAIPPILGIALAVSLSCWMGLPFKLTTTLSIILSYGMCFNFSLYVALANKHVSTPFTVTTFATASVIVSGILLMVCSSPAIQTIGLTVALSLFFTWLLTPLMRRY